MRSGEAIALPASMEFPICRWSARAQISGEMYVGPVDIQDPTQACPDNPQSVRFNVIFSGQVMAKPIGLDEMPETRHLNSGQQPLGDELELTTGCRPRYRPIDHQRLKHQ